MEDFLSAIGLYNREWHSDYCKNTLNVIKEANKLEKSLKSYVDQQRIFTESLVEWTSTKEPQNETLIHLTKILSQINFEWRKSQDYFRECILKVKNEFELLTKDFGEKDYFDHKHQQALQSLEKLKQKAVAKGANWTNDNHVLIRTTESKYYRAKRDLEKYTQNRDRQTMIKIKRAFKQLSKGFMLMGGTAFNIYTAFDTIVDDLLPETIYRSQPVMVTPGKYLSITGNETSVSPDQGVLNTPYAYRMSGPYDNRMTTHQNNSSKARRMIRYDHNDTRRSITSSSRGQEEKIINLEHSNISQTDDQEQKNPPKVESHHPHHESVDRTRGKNLFIHPQIQSDEKRQQDDEDASGRDERRVETRVASTDASGYHSSHEGYSSSSGVAADIRKNEDDDQEGREKTDDLLLMTPNPPPDDVNDLQLMMTPGIPSGEDGLRTSGPDPQNNTTHDDPVVIPPEAKKRSSKSGVDSEKHTSSSSNSGPKDRMILTNIFGTHHDKDGCLERHSNQPDPTGLDQAVLRAVHQDKSTGRKNRKGSSTHNSNRTEARGASKSRSPGPSGVISSAEQELASTATTDIIDGSQ